MSSKRDSHPNTISVTNRKVANQVYPIAILLAEYLTFCYHALALNNLTR